MLYLHHSTPEASPKAISGRTSYLQVRLAFHPYPQLITQFCNIEAFGPPRSITFASPWPWVAHLVSGPILATKRPIRTRFRYGSGCYPLNLATKIDSPGHSPKGTRSGKSRPKTGQRPPTDCRHTVSGSISLRSPRFFSPFPHGTGTLSVVKSI